MKRFTETQKWQDSWFMDLPAKWKLAWYWILDNCDHAGVVEANPRLMSFVIGEPIDGDEFIRVMGGRVTKPKHGKWFVPQFIAFQYGDELNPKNSAHKGVIRKLSEAGIACPVRVIDCIDEAPSKPLQSPCQGAQDKDKDKDKDKELDKEPKKASKATKPETVELPEMPAQIRTPRLVEAWDNWIAFRASLGKKKAVTAFGANQSFKDFAAWGEAGAIASIENSIRNGWQGLFEPSAKPVDGQKRSEPKLKYV